jgi:hypothetical protein
MLAFTVECKFRDVLLSYSPYTPLRRAALDYEAFDGAMLRMLGKFRDVF